MLRAAWYYYKDELTQDEIARRLSMSRASVGRLLDRVGALPERGLPPADQHHRCTRRPEQACGGGGADPAARPGHYDRAALQRQVHGATGNGGCGGSHRLSCIDRAAKDCHNSF